MTAKTFPIAQLFAAALAALPLAACNTTDDQQARWLVAPGKYVLFNCQALAAQAHISELRRIELEALMAKSGSELANTFAYRGEYLAVRGDLSELHHEAAEKHCKPMPMAKQLPNSASGTAIR